MADQNQGIQLHAVRPALKKLGGLGRTKFYEHVADGVLPKPIKIGGRSFWREDELDAAIEKLTAERT